MAQDKPIFFKRRMEQHRKGDVFEVQVMASRVILKDQGRMLISIVSKWFG
jgi:hypothetical protein